MARHQLTCGSTGTRPGRVGRPGSSSPPLARPRTKRPQALTPRFHLRYNDRPTGRLADGRRVRDAFRIENARNWKNFFFSRPMEAAAAATALVHDIGDSSLLRRRLMHSTAALPQSGLQIRNGMQSLWAGVGGKVLPRQGVGWGGAALLPDRPKDDDEIGRAKEHVALRRAGPRPCGRVGSTRRGPAVGRRRLESKANNAGRISEQYSTPRRQRSYSISIRCFTVDSGGQRSLAFALALSSSAVRHR